jgi:hypothetical protein
MSDEKVVEVVVERRFTLDDSVLERLSSLEQENLRLKAKLAKATDVLRTCGAMLASWVKVMDDMRADPDDPTTAIQEHFHGKRIKLSREAVAAVEAALKRNL